ncbi:MAG: hypothetical protein GC145_08610 [Caulobacter sp.]|nr:hypothetical protein [Caulobacter sp.]
MSQFYDGDDRQTMLSPQDKMVNLALSRILANDGLFVEPDTGQVMRFRPGTRQSLPGTDQKVEGEVVTRLEAQQFRERRLGAGSYKEGVMSKEEELYRQMNFGRVDNEPRLVIDPKRPVPDIFAPRNYRLEPGDENLLARMTFAEAGVAWEDYEALAWATLNRVGVDFRHTLFDVLVEPGAYDIVKEGGLGRDNDLWLASANPEKMSAGNRANWERANLVARGVLSGQIPDPTEGGNFFFASPNFDGDKNSVPGRMKSIYGNLTPTPYKSRSRKAVKHYIFKGVLQRVRPDKPARPRAEVLGTH